MGELSRSSRDSFESDSDSKESWDDRLNSFKSGVSKFLRFLNIESIEHIEHNPYRSYRSKATLYDGLYMTMVRLASKKQFFVIFGRTDLRISLSGAKFDADVDVDFRLARASPRPYQIYQK